MFDPNDKPEREAVRFKLIDALIPLEKLAEKDLAQLSELEAARLKEIVRDLQGLEINLWRMRQAAR